MPESNTKPIHTEISCCTCCMTEGCSAPATHMRAHPKLGIALLCDPCGDRESEATAYLLSDDDLMRGLVFQARDDGIKFRLMHVMVEILYTALEAGADDAGDVEDAVEALHAAIDELKRRAGDETMRLAK